MQKKIVTHSSAVNFVGQVYPYVGQHFVATTLTEHSEGEIYNVLTKFCRVFDDFLQKMGPCDGLLFLLK